MNIAKQVKLLWNWVNCYIVKKNFIVNFAKSFNLSIESFEAQVKCAASRRSSVGVKIF